MALDSTWYPHRTDHEPTRPAACRYATAGLEPAAPDGRPATSRHSRPPKCASGRRSAWWVCRVAQHAVPVPIRPLELSFDDDDTATGARRVGRPDPRAEAGASDTRGDRRPLRGWQDDPGRRTGSLRGKTTRPVRRVTIDHFKRHVDMRTQNPPGSPESYHYYFEMFDVDALRDDLLAPLGPVAHGRACPLEGGQLAVDAAAACSGPG